MKAPKELIELNEWAAAYAPHFKGDRFFAAREGATLERLRAGAGRWNDWAEEMLLLGAHLSGRNAEIWRDMASVALSGHDFSELDVSGRIFPADAAFARCAFRRDAAFTASVFAGPLRFTESVFHGALAMSNARFYAPTHFGGCRFFGRSDFSFADFSGATTIAAASFHGDAWFRSARFGAELTFSDATFEKDAGLHYMVVEGDAFFRGVEFLDTVSFEHASFRSSADFDHCVARRGLHSTGIRFGQGGERDGFDAFARRSALEAAKNGAAPPIFGENVVPLRPHRRRRGA